MKKLLILFLFLFSLTLVSTTFAANNAFVSIINPVRGADFWDIKGQEVETAVFGQIGVLDKYNLPATWLIRFDALDNVNVINQLKNRPSDEKGLFLEVTPSWSSGAKVQYHKSDSWHSAGSAFLTGYEQEERAKLIDAAFEKFKSIFGFYPKSVGAWWLDSFSLGYMQKKFGIIAALVVSDQYTTDNYQIWGQYFSTPYYPSIQNALAPAQSLENKLPVVIMQWAPRDPVNAYGNGVQESTYSVQANDYIDYHNLGSDYFASLLDIYTKQPFNQFSQIVVGLENSYFWDKYKKEYENQLQILTNKEKAKQLTILTMKDFGSFYKSTFPDLSPTHLIVADDPLGSDKKAVWFMNPYFRAGWFYNADGSVFRDIRQYIEGEEEICFRKRCDEVNFATFATRVLDEVTYGHKWVIDEGKISNFKVFNEGEKYVISYTSAAGNSRRIEFLPRDIGVDGKISSIDGAILAVITQEKSEQQKASAFKGGGFSWTLGGILSKTLRFALFIIFVCLIPGFVLINRLEKDSLKKIFLSLITGLVLLTIIFYITSFLNARYLIVIYLIFNLILFIKLKIYQIELKLPSLTKEAFLTFLLIVAGTIFQNIPTFRSGLTYPYGLGFWGPNTHDGIWHLSLINQLIKGLPAQNPIFAEITLKNYHFFYDLTVAATAYFTKIPNIDLVFRFYPIFFSLLLGIGTFCLTSKLFKNTYAAIFSLYLVYFSGSFGWIVDYIKNNSFGGESAFWANQSISFNLNPPLAISILIIIAFLLLLKKLPAGNKLGIFLPAILLGFLIGFKSYGAILTIGSLAVISIVNLFKKEFSYLYICIISTVLSLIIFIANFNVGQQLVIFSPFWFIHSMIDSPDRVGWTRLALSRTVGWQTNNWVKFLSAEAIGLFIFIAGNLGMRFLSLFSLFKIQTILKDNMLFFIFVFSVLSFSIPILFIQSGNPWNTIQFSYYGLYMTAVVSSIVIVWIISRLHRLFSLLLVGAVLILAPINSITTATYYMGSSPHALISQKEMEALQFLSQEEDGVVLTFPYDKKLKNKLSEPWPLFAYDSTAYVSALSSKQVFVEDEPQNQILLTDYKERVVAAKGFFFSSGQRQKQFLSDSNIKYIYLPKIFNQSLDESLAGVVNIFENEEAIIYRVK